MLTDPLLTLIFPLFGGGHVDMLVSRFGSIILSISRFKHELTSRFRHVFLRWWAAFCCRLWRGQFWVGGNSVVGTIPYCRWLLWALSGMWGRGNVFFPPQELAYGEFKLLFWSPRNSHVRSVNLYMSCLWGCCFDQGRALACLLGFCAWGLQASLCRFCFSVSCLLSVVFLSLRAGSETCYITWKLQVLNGLRICKQAIWLTLGVSLIGHLIGLIVLRILSLSIGERISQCELPEANYSRSSPRGTQGQHRSKVATLPHEIYKKMSMAGGRCNCKCFNQWQRTVNRDRPRI